MDNGIIKINKSEVDLNKGLLMLKNHQSIEKSLDKVLHHISKSIIKKHIILNGNAYHSYNTLYVDIVLKRDYGVILGEYDLLLFERLIDLYIANNRELLLN